MVWKGGLLLKIQKTGVRGKMYGWLSDFLLHRTARVKLIYAHAHIDYRDLDARSQWVGKGKQISVDLSRQLSNQYAFNLLQRKAIFK